jgi:hypothetical protein
VPSAGLGLDLSLTCASCEQSMKRYGKEVGRILYTLSRYHVQLGGRRQDRHFGSACIELVEKNLGT